MQLPQCRQLSVARPTNAAKPCLLQPSAVKYFEAVFKDLSKLDPTFQQEDAQLLVLRIWHIVDAAEKKTTISIQHIKDMIKPAFDKLPEAIRSRTETPVETTLELLIRTLVCLLKGVKTCVVVVNLRW